MPNRGSSPEEPRASKAPPERRASDRVHLEVEVTLHSDSHFFAGLSGNVSEGGLFVQTYRELPIGHPVSLRFELPGGNVLVPGSVRWIRTASEGCPPGLGIAFGEALNDTEKNLISEFCTRRPPLFYDMDETVVKS
jgi:uncharacterized protein (TIGR02266 family)